MFADRRRRLEVLLAFALAIAALLRADTFKAAALEESSARKDVEDLIQRTGATVSLAFHSLNGEQELFLREADRYSDTNALRLPIMIELYAEAEAGELKLTDSLLVHDGVRITPDAIPYHMDRKADPTVVASVGKTRTLGELCEEMITRNSNFATNLLLERLTLQRVRDRIDSLGADGMEIAAAFPNSDLNHTTTYAVFVVLWQLATEQAVSSNASKEMIGMMARSGLHPSPTPPPVIPVPIPPRPASAGPVAIHDAVIIYGAHSHVLVIEVRGMPDAASSAQLIATIAKALADAT